MRLDFEQIKSITAGAEDIVWTEHGYEFIRFNKDERELYLTSPLERRTHTPAGVELIFKTDGDRIDIKLEAQVCCDRSFFCLDIIEGGKLIGSVKNFEEEKMTGFYSWDKYPVGSFEGGADLKKGIKEIRLVLPWSVQCFIKEISISNARYVIPVKKDKVMLSYGDSITHGYDSAHPSNTYPSRLALCLGCETFVKAVGGENFFPALAKIKSSKNPDYVTIAYGTNDWSSKNKGAFDKKSAEFIENIKQNYPESKIFVITPIWRKDNVTQNTEFEDIFYIGKRLSEICKGSDNVFCIDGWELVPHDENLYGDLRLHPNDTGFDFYCNNLLKRIQKHI